jgi:hypothetical protein
MKFFTVSKPIFALACYETATWSTLTRRRCPFFMSGTVETGWRPHSIANSAYLRPKRRCSSQPCQSCAGRSLLRSSLDFVRCSQRPTTLCIRTTRRHHADERARSPRSRAGAASGNSPQRSFRCERRHLSVWRSNARIHNAPRPDHSRMTGRVRPPPRAAGLGCAQSN